MNVFCDDRKISLDEPVSEQSSPANLNDNSPFICNVRRCVFSVSSWDKIVLHAARSLVRNTC